MWSTRNRNEVMKLLGRRLVLLSLCIVTIALASGVWNIAGKAREAATLKKQAEAHLLDLTNRQKQLTSDIQNLKTDRGKEEALREQYALAAQGEHMIVIVDPSEKTPETASTSGIRWFQNFLWW